MIRVLAFDDQPGACFSSFYEVRSKVRRALRKKYKGHGGSPNDRRPGDKEQDVSAILSG